MIASGIVQRRGHPRRVGSHSTCYFHPFRTPSAPVGHDVHFPRKRTVWPMFVDCDRSPRQGQLRTPIASRSRIKRRRRKGRGLRRRADSGIGAGAGGDDGRNGEPRGGVIAHYGVESRHALYQIGPSAEASVRARSSCLRGFPAAFRRGLKGLTQTDTQAPSLLTLRSSRILSNFAPVASPRSATSESATSSLSRFSQRLQPTASNAKLVINYVRRILFKRET